MVSKGIPKDSGEDNRFFNLPPPDVMYVHLHGTTFSVNKRCMASRSGKFAQILNQRNNPPITSYTFSDIPTDEKTFSLIVNFCHGRSPDISPVNVAPLACLASFLEMTEDCMPNNLLKRTVAYISAEVLPYWNETVKMYRTIEPLVDCSKKLGLLQALLDSIAEKVYSDPCLLMNLVESYGTGPRRMLCLPDWRAEDLTSLSPQLFLMAIMAVVHAGVTEDHVSRCLYRYAMKRATPPATDVGVAMVYENSHQREVIEPVQVLLSTKKGVLHVSKLSELLRLAISLQASAECRSGFEARIANQLAEAKMGDLILPSCSYTDETNYDYEAVRRILTRFCSNNHSGDGSGEEELKAVAKLVEEFLWVAAKDRNLKKETFVSLLGMLVSILHPLGRSHDNAYRAVDIYLEARGHLTESEREEVCRRLEVRKLSVAACEHATLNERLPMRIITQVLFVGQKRIRDAMEDAMMDADGSTPKEAAVAAAAEKKRDVETWRMEESGSRVETGVEKTGKCRDCGSVSKKRKRNFWKGMRWKFGCKGEDHNVEEDEDVDDDNCNCQHVRKKKMKNQPG